MLPEVINNTAIWAVILVAVLTVVLYSISLGLITAGFIRRRKGREGTAVNRGIFKFTVMFPIISATIWTVAFYIVLLEGPFVYVAEVFTGYYDPWDPPRIAIPVTMAVFFATLLFAPPEKCTITGKDWKKIWTYYLTGTFLSPWIALSAVLLTALFLPPEIVSLTFNGAYNAFILFFAAVFLTDPTRWILYILYFTFGAAVPMIIYNILFLPLIEYLNGSVLPRIRRKPGNAASDRK